MANSSDDIKRNKDKLAQAETLKKQAENLSVWIAQLTSDAATVQYIQLAGPDNTFLSLDETNYGVHANSKSFIITLLTNKVATINSEVSTLLAEVDAEIP